jgi:hypothetical protein
MFTGIELRAWFVEPSGLWARRAASASAVSKRVLKAMVSGLFSGVVSE